MNKWSIFLAATTALLPVPALAQTAQPAASDADADTNSEIVVTAQKRSERLKDVPAAITAVTSANLQELNAAKLDDYVARIPGLTVSQAGGAAAATQLTIRGITTGAGGNPTVGIYIDESPFGASSGIGGYTVPDLDPQDLARVEVLRGPQGTLYGAGSLGGLLKYVTADPDPSRFFGRLQVDGSAVDGGGEGYSLRAAANIPLSDDLALRVSGYNRRDPGFIDNVLTGERNYNDTRFYGGRAALGWQRGDWKIRLSGLFQHYDGSAPIVDYDSVTFQPVNGDLKQSRVPGSTKVKQDIGAVSLLVEGDLGFATLTSATAYNHQTGNFPIDYTTILGPVLGPVFGDIGYRSATPVKVEKFTQELRLASPATNTLSWQLGLFYTRETQALSTSFVPIDIATGATIPGIPDLGSGTLDTKFREIAIFGDVTYRLSSAFDITAGLRYSENRQHSIAIYSGLLFPNTTVESPSRDNAVTFLINPRLHLDANTMVYARFASGFRPGGPNTVAPPLPQSYAPDRVTDYEIGLKSDLFDRMLSLELAAFLIDWKKIQIQRVAPLGSFIDNGPSAVSKGIEASASLRPMRGLELYGNITYTDAHLTKDLPANSGGVSGAIGVDGDRLPLTSRWGAAAGANYSVPLSGDWNAIFGVDWRHVGARLGAFPNPGQVRYQLPSYDVFDARIGVSDDRWSLTLYAKNIGDARGQSTDVNPGTGLTAVSVLQPRTFGVSAAVKF